MYLRHQYILFTAVQIVFKATKAVELSVFRCVYLQAKTESSLNDAYYG